MCVAIIMVFLHVLLVMCVLLVMSVCVCYPLCYCWWGCVCVGCVLHVVGGCVAGIMVTRVVVDTCDVTTTLLLV